MTLRRTGFAAPFRSPFGRRVRSLRGATRVAFLLLLSAVPLDGQMLDDYDFRTLEFRGIGFEMGRMWAARVEPTLVYGIRLDLGLIGSRVRITPATSFWASSMQAAELNRLAEQIILVCERQGDVSCPERLDLGEVRLSDLEMTVDAHYLFLHGRGISPYIGAGLALHLLNGRGESIDGTFVEDLLDSVAPGLAPVFGVSIHLAREFRVSAEARFMLASDVRYASVGMGGVWTLPSPRRTSDGIRSERRQ